jgi:elongation factor P
MRWRRSQSVPVTTAQFKNGMCVIHDGKRWVIIEFQHVKPGKGGAFVRTRLKNMKTGGVIDKTFRAGEKMDQAFLNKRSMQYLYRQGEELTLMDMDSYEQVPFESRLFGDQLLFLKEEMMVTVLDVEGEVMGIELPNSVELEVTDTEPGFKGDTVASSGKPATLETGAKINVPFHINVGDVLRIDTRTGEYLERVKK